MALRLIAEGSWWMATVVGQNRLEWSFRISCLSHETIKVMPHKQ